MGPMSELNGATPTCAALLVCRACGKKADHSTSKCPDKNLAAPLDSFSDKPDTSTSKPDMRPSPNDTYYAVRVTGLSDDISEHDVRELFESFGTIRSVYVPVDKRTNKSVGSALVRFWNREDAQKEIYKLSWCRFQNKVLRLFWM
ncbi:hypothetical protein MKX01_021741 [Papaver californicum]|nr:hypothetical protein MKX01_021741 [Papaver californicum]